MAAAEEIRMLRKVHNHDRKCAYLNDGQRQEWWGGLFSITHVSIRGSYVSHTFLYLPISNARKDMGDRVYIQITPKDIHIYSRTLQSKD